MPVTNESEASSIHSPAGDTATQADSGDADRCVATSPVDKSLLTKPTSAKAKFWGDPIYLFKDWKQREARGEKGAHCVQCGSDLRCAERAGICSLVQLALQCRFAQGQA